MTYSKPYDFIHYMPKTLRNRFILETNVRLVYLKPLAFLFGKMGLIFWFIIQAYTFCWRACMQIVLNLHLFCKKHNKRFKVHVRCTRLWERRIKEKSKELVILLVFIQLTKSISKMEFRTKKVSLLKEFRTKYMNTAVHTCQPIFIHKF